jgi:hypothetical protein
LISSKACRVGYLQKLTDPLPEERTQHHQALHGTYCLKKSGLQNIIFSIERLVLNIKKQQTLNVETIARGMIDVKTYTHEPHLYKRSIKEIRSSLQYIFVTSEKRKLNR